MTNNSKMALEALDELENYLNSAKYALFSNSQVMVDRVKAEEYIQLIRSCISQQIENKENEDN